MMGQIERLFCPLKKLFFLKCYLLPKTLMGDENRSEHIITYVCSKISVVGIYFFFSSLFGNPRQRICSYNFIFTVFS